MLLFENINLVPSAQQMVRTGHTGGSRTDHGHALGDRRVLLPGITVKDRFDRAAEVVCGKTFEILDRHRAVNLSTHTGTLAGTHADTPARSHERVMLKQHTGG